MQWSKLKSRVERFFAASVSGRVEVRTTSYRHAHDGEGRGWITLDGEEIGNFCTRKYWVERSRLERGIREANSATSIRDPAKREAYFAASKAATEILDRRGILSQGSFEHALEEYLSMPVGVALESGCLLHRALAVVDCRVGKRRLQKIVPRAEEHPLVIRLLEFRCAQEKIGFARDVRSVGEAAG